jgi:hypothetical protein
MNTNITTTTLVNVLAGGITRNANQAVYAQRIAGKFRAESPAFLGNRGLENSIRQRTGCEFFADTMHIVSFFTELFGEEADVEYAARCSAAQLLIAEVNRRIYFEPSTTTLTNVLSGGLAPDSTFAVYALRVDGRFSPDSPALLGLRANENYLVARTGYEFFATSQEILNHYTECFGDPASAGYTALRRAAQALVHQRNENLSATA